MTLTSLTRLAMLKVTNFKGETFYLGSDQVAVFLSRDSVYCAVRSEDPFNALTVKAYRPSDGEDYLPFTAEAASSSPPWSWSPCRSTR